ncbi:MAG TPA: hypothetical protein VFU65_02225 [Actinocrinis sp.]|nr:hypothetical protein [Actinocrinis sp.]
MPILTAAVIVVGALCVLNLILIDAIIRRLREISSRLGGKEDGKLLPVGSEIGAVAVGAGHIKQGTKTVVLMSTTCSACLSVLEATVGYARDLPGAADILVAIQGEGGNIEEMTAALGEVATLVTGTAAADLVTALQGRAFPSFYLLEDGRVRAAAHTPLMLPSPVPSR